jgi:hypothetical protein
MSYEKLRTSAVLMIEHHSTLLWAAAQWYHCTAACRCSLQLLHHFSAWTMAVSLLYDARGSFTDSLIFMRELASE